ncbi:MAG: 50S ribosomal protein L29 [Patescibacteria group bacterium]|mgnify:CR=1 FL=1
MKIKEIKDLKTKTVKDLETLVSKKKLELVKNTVKIAGGKEKNLKVAWILRKEIAQIMTVIKTKGLEGK